MIIGVGIDIVEVARVKRALGRKGFASVTFTPAEMKCYKEAGSPIGTLAARFAAKEAVFKALGTGWVAGTEVEILPNKEGKPLARLSGETLKRSKKARVKTVHVSLSSHKDYAIGLAVAEA